MSKILARFGFYIGGILVLLFLVNQFLFNRGISWSDAALTSSGAFASEDATERAVLHDLAIKIRMAPEQATYSVDWTRKGTPPVSYIEGTTVFWAESHIEHREKQTGKSHMIGDVNYVDILATASQTGNFDHLKKQIQKRLKKHTQLKKLEQMGNKKL